MSRRTASVSSAWDDRPRIGLRGSKLSNIGEGEPMESIKGVPTETLQTPDRSA